MKKIYFLFCIVLVLSLSACDLILSGDSFFRNSLGSGMSRNFNPANVNINASNAASWVNRATGNSDLAYVVSSVIMDELKNGSLSDGEKLVLIDAGVKLSIEASGVGTSIFSNALPELENLFDDDFSGDASEILQQILNGVQQDFQANGGLSVADNLASIIDHAIDHSSSIPSLSSEYVDNASLNDVALTVIILTLGVVEDEFDGKVITPESMSTFINDLDNVSIVQGGSNDGTISINGDVDEKIVALAAVYNTLVLDPDFAGGFLGGLLGIFD